ncbi:MAG: GNAT family N-acetyltransferase [Lachnospiraceae bacterium]|nr:GNAT family N-acetyltransferase [Clostridiales bacterium]MBR6849598.1 GNAT family N-acetyltransferase [Lachnospiraceae bacterium]
MQTRKLTIEEIREVYEKYLYYDFPDDERKPLSRIEQSIREGRYLCAGAFDEDGGFLAYAFFVFEKDVCLLDYYAVVPEMRGKGIGSAFLKEAVNHAGFGTNIIEIEDPDAGDTDKEKMARKRRLDFYLNAGCVNTHVHVLVFGVEYLLLEYPVNTVHSGKEITDGYFSIYRSILPKKMYEANISLLDIGAK